ncbi:Zn(2)-C6 fungal-type domain-containing protein [Fusarium sp. Ph1]|nr:Zn(2)-C6 fungal-type domain-containing protein [Fusarium sp. Ph1]
MGGDTQGSGPSGEAVESQRPMIRACDMCRIKKIRCQPTKQGCLQCTKFKTKCHFTPIATKRKPRRPAGYKYIAQLEERLQNMENVLEKALQRAKSTEGEAPAEEGTMDLEPVESSEKQPQSDVVVASPPQRVTNIFPSSWFNTIPGDFTEILNSTASPLRPSPSFTVGMALGPFSLPTFQELPTKPVALDLVMDTFKSFNRFFPLFDEQDFLQKFDRHYLTSSPSNPGWWACINIVLSLAHRFRSMRMFETGYESAQACGYCHNALAVVAELNVLHNSLPAVQALVGMAVVLQGSANSHPASVLTAAAVRLAQAMGLHRKTRDNGLTEAQNEQRRRVFWIAYVLDKDISLRMGQPFSQDDDDMDVELPSGILSKLPFNRDGPCTIDLFKSRIGLAVIQGQVYKRLYSVQASQQSEAQKASVAKELDSILSYWRSGVDVDVESDRVAVPLSPEALHVLILRFTYINCLIMVNRHLPSRQQLVVNEGSDTQGTYAPLESDCTIESRKAVRLMHLIPHGDYACVWILLHPFFAAVTTLLQNALDRPACPNAQSDLETVQPFFRLLDVLAAEERTCYRSNEARKMHRECNDLLRRASEAVGCMSMVFDSTALIEVV